MKESHEFLMPDYYPRFACKMGACREACCVGWPIAFSLEDYFHLSTLDCSPALRDTIDRGVRIALEPRPDRYAEVVPRYDGDCSLRLPDGRCSLQAELGEDALTDVCCLYPRGIRCDEGYEISCANSCEAVLELLFKQEAPIGFVKKTLTVRIPPAAARKVAFETLHHARELRLWFIRQLQQRQYSLPERLKTLESCVCRAEAALEKRDEQALLAMMAAPYRPAVLRKNADPKSLLAGIEKAERLQKLVDERSPGVSRYGEEALAYFTGGGDVYARYLEAKNKFEKLVPKWELYYEHMLVNHMFFSEFPLQDRPESFHDEYASLCVIYTLLRFLCIGWLAQHYTENAFTDICAAAFRLIDHTDFEHYAIYLLKKTGMNSGDSLDEWIIL